MRYYVVMALDECGDEFRADERESLNIQTLMRTTSSLQSCATDGSLLLWIW